MRHTRKPPRIPSAPLRFRRATAGDIRAMSAIRLSVTENILSDPAKVTEQMYRDYLHRLGRGWVCCAGRKVVGFAYASRDDASIWALFVQPGCEGRGIGRRLLAHAAGWLFARGHGAVSLSTGRGTRAEAFYRAQGWVPEREHGGEVRLRLAEPSRSAGAAAPPAAAPVLPDPGRPAPPPGAAGRT